MAISLERAATMVDRRGHTSLQGVFLGKEFNHLVGKSIEIEKMPIRELTLFGIYNAFDDMSSSSREKNIKEFTHIMFLAFAEAQYSQGRGRMKLAGKVTDKLFEGSASVKIYSRPQIKGVRVKIHNPEIATIVIDLTKDYIKIKLKQEPELGSRKMGITEFLEEVSDYHPEDTEYTEQQVAIGRNLEEAIFR